MSTRRERDVLIAELRDEANGMDETDAYLMIRAADALEASAADTQRLEAELEEILARWRRVHWRIRRDIKIIGAFEGGDSIAEIAALFDLSTHRIRQILRAGDREGGMK